MLSSCRLTLGLIFRSVWLRNAAHSAGLEGLEANSTNLVSWHFRVFHTSETLPRFIGTRVVRHRCPFSSSWRSTSVSSSFSHSTQGRKRFAKIKNVLEHPLFDGGKDSSINTILNVI